MAQVVIRGESVYECDTCKRRIRVPTNRQGLDVLQRCNITAGCEGELRRVTSLKDINSTPAFPPEVAGLQDWFPRNVLYIHKHPVRAASWVVQHNLMTVPNLHVFIDRVVDGEETQVDFGGYTVGVVDATTLVISFPSAESGQVHCVSASSKNTVNFAGVIPTTPTVTLQQVSSNNGEITLATLNSDQLIDVSITFLTAEGLTLEYSGVDNVPSSSSPWVGANKTVINGRRYTLRSLNLLNTPPAPTYFQSGQIVSGTTFFVSQINDTAISTNEVLFLLGTAPYTAIDRVTTAYIDAASVSTSSPEMFMSGSVAQCSTAVVKSTYPPILVV